jgi:hypothetical protein
MASNGSPYSRAVQPVVAVTIWVLPLVHCQMLAWDRPKLWPSSWTVARRSMYPLIQLTGPPSIPSPAKRQLACRGK